MVKMITSVVSGEANQEAYEALCGATDSTPDQIARFTQAIVDNTIAKAVASHPEGEEMIDYVMEKCTPKTQDSILIALFHGDRSIIGRNEDMYKPRNKSF